jgi:hypothetical protein
MFIISKAWGATKPNCQACRVAVFTIQCLTKALQDDGAKFSSIKEGLSDEVLTAVSLLQSALLEILAAMYEGKTL